jgi:Tol biopolymer transport system component
VRHWRWTATTLLAAAGISGAGAPPLWAAPDDTVLVDRATGALGVKARGGSPGLSQISPDGRYVTFISTASNLDPSDHDATIDVFLRDLRMDTTLLVSRADGALGAKGNGHSAVGDGLATSRYVVFTSLASNLDPDDPDTIPDVYLRDILTGETTLVSRADGAAGEKANADTVRGRLSADGRLVAFGSTASNLDPADDQADPDVFVRDLMTHQTTLVSVGVAEAELAAFSDDGTHVAYLVHSDLYVQDLRTGSRSFVSARVSTTGVSLSADGRYVAFSSRATDLHPADSDRRPDVYVRNVAAGTTTLASRADGRTGAKGNGESLYGGSLSADGRLVAFASAARNLDPVDSTSDNELDIFVRDLRTGRTTLASRSSSGAKGNKSSVWPSLSGNGRFMVFSSDAHNFDPVDRDYATDVYVRDLLARLPSPGRRPRSWIRSLRQTGPLGQGGFFVTGRAKDDGEVQVVEVSLTRRLPDGRCQRWSAVWVRTPRRGDFCRGRFDLAAHFTKRWQRPFEAEVRPGTYELRTRAIDTAGQRERTFSVERGNRRVFRIR